jgi:hypothetical protein
MRQASEMKTNGTYQRKQTTLPPRKVNWWLRMTSNGWDKPLETIQQRETARRSVLLSWILLGLFVALILFIPATLTNVPSIFAVLIAAIVLIICIFLNRRGLVTIAGVCVVVLAITATMGVVIGSPDHQIHLVYLPAYDFLVVSVILGAAILPRSSAFLIAAIDIIIIYADLIFQDKSSDLTAAISMYSLPTLAGRPVVILVIAAVISFLWARGMEEAVKRADRAEELQLVKQQFVEMEAARTRQVEDFVQETINAINALANGQEGLLLLPAGHPWYPQALFINAQLKQFYKLKQANKGDNEHIAYAAEILLTLLQRNSQKQALISALDPRQFSTPVPVINEIAKCLYQLLQNEQRGQVTTDLAQQSLTPPIQTAPLDRDISRPWDKIRLVRTPKGRTQP